MIQPGFFQRIVNIFGLVCLVICVQPISAQNQSALHSSLENSTRLVTTSTTGGQTDSHSSDPSITPDGRFVVFSSWATNLIPGGTNQFSVYLKDLSQNTTEVISVNSSGGQTAGNHPAISADGRFIVFDTPVYNIIQGDTNNSYDIYLRDRKTGQSERISVDSNGNQSNANSMNPSISADGRYVVFESVASNLVDGDTNNQQDIFLRDRLNKTTTRVSLASDASQANSGSSEAVISSNGRYVAFVSQASNLVPGGNQLSNVYLTDLQTHSVELISVSSARAPGNHHSSSPSISSNGDFIAFQSYASNLAPGDTNSNIMDIFLRNRISGTTDLVSHSPSGVSGNDASWNPSISGDGRWIAYKSRATTLVAGDTNGAIDIFIYDDQSSRNKLASISSSGAQANNHSDNPKLSSGGNFLVYDSTASNLADGDTNTITDIFLYTGNEITQVQINQGLGKQQGPPVYVAGKETVIRVFLEFPTRIDPSQQQVIVKRNGVTLTNPPLRPEASPAGSAAILDFFCPSDACGAWPAGEYTFETTINGNSRQDMATFQSRRRLRILAVPIKVYDLGVTKSLISGPWKNDLWKVPPAFLFNSYPIMENGVDWDLSPTELDATSFVLNDEQMQFDLLSLLHGMQQPFQCRLPFVQKCYDTVIGFVPQMDILCNTVSCSPGFTNILGTVVMIDGPANQYSMEQAVAHEIGHVFGLGDEYNHDKAHYQCLINPPPPLYKKGACPKSTAIPWGGAGATGSTILGTGKSQVFPYDVKSKQALGDRLSFMGSGAPLRDYWVSPAIYQHLFSQIGPTSQRSASVSIQRVIQASGSVSKTDEVVIKPWFHFDAEPDPAVTGAYTIEALDSSNQVLASQGFDVSFTLLSDPPQETDTAPFEVIVPFPFETTSFRIMKGSTQLKLVPVSSHLPTVSVISPNGGEVWNENQTYTIHWSGSDLDSDLLTYRVLYTPDGANWITLSPDTSATSLVVDTTLLPGGIHGRIWVIASDGINTAEDSSDANFSVANKPPIVTIYTPSDHAFFPPGSPIFLSGYGYSLEDGTLAEEALRWTLDGASDLGTGSTLLVNLPLGDHEVKLTVVSSSGATSTSIIHIYSGFRVLLPNIQR